MKRPAGMATLEQSKTKLETQVRNEIDAQDRDEEDERLVRALAGVVGAADEVLRARSPTPRRST